MLEIRRDADIHREQGGWFDARWHFSFDQYRDPAQMGIGPLRVFNDDRLVAGADWPMHPHADVEGLVIAILLGMAIRTAWRPSERWRSGIAFSAKQLLEVAVAPDEREPRPLRCALVCVTSRPHVGRVHVP